MLGPGGLEAPGPFLVTGTQWRRWTREHPEGAFADFVEHVNEQNAFIKAAFLKVSAKELLSRWTHREQKRLIAWNDAPIFNLKPEPIEISSDSDSDPIDMEVLRAQATTSKGRAAIAADLARRKNELDEMEAAIGRSSTRLKELHAQ